MRKTIERYVVTCTQCQLTKPQQLLRQGDSNLLTPQVVLSNKLGTTCWVLSGALRIETSGSLYAWITSFATLKRVLHHLPLLQRSPHFCFVTSCYVIYHPKS